MRTYRGVRSDLGKTIPQMAKLLGIKPSTYKSMESGKTKATADVHIKMMELGGIESAKDLDIPKRK